MEKLNVPVVNRMKKLFSLNYFSVIIFILLHSEHQKKRQFRIMLPFEYVFPSLSKWLVPTSYSCNSNARTCLQTFWTKKHHIFQTGLMCRPSFIVTNTVKAKDHTLHLYWQANSICLTYNSDNNLFSGDRPLGRDLKASNFLHKVRQKHRSYLWN